ncbi:MAG TPA: hypothetical protein VIK01_09775, partial [Polyangiaceae bacterium]
MNDFRSKRPFWSSFGSIVFALLTPARAYAQDAPNVGRIAEFIRWGGIAVSVPIIIGAMFLIRLVENAGERFSTRFSNRRPTIQKVQTS